MQVIHKVREIVGRRHALAIATAGSVVLAALAGLGIAFGGVLWRVGLGALAVMFLADVVWLVQEWLDEWRYQRLVDDYEEAARTGRPQLLDVDVTGIWGRADVKRAYAWPVPHDMEERVDMGSAYDNGETYVGDPVQEAYAQGCWDAMGLDDDDVDVDVSDTQTGQGVE